MQLLRELTEDVKYIFEAATADKPKEYFIEGIFLQSNLKNRNGRIYPKDIMANEVGRYVKESIESNRAFGELGHPANPSVNLDRVSHIIKSLKEDGDNWVGKAKIMDTPFGKIVKSFIDEGACLGISSRGMSSLVEVNGAQIVQNNFKLLTAGDVVSDPSGPNCFIQGIMEDKEWVYEASTNSYIIAETIKKVVKSITTKELATRQSALFEHFLNNLR